MNADHLQLLLFSNDVELAQAAARAGVDGIIIDWESKGKHARQHGFDMEINADTPEDLERVAAAVELPVTVRINALSAQSGEEIALALSLGARSLMLPMAQSADEVARFLDLVDGRARTIVQIETQPLVDQLEAMGRLPWDSAYIGLHDLMLSRQAPSMWLAVLDGTVERIYRTLEGRSVGFAGATVIGGGHPIRFTQILQELARLGAGLTFLRRSFRRELQDRDMAAEITALRSAWQATRARGPEAIESDRARLYADLQHLTAI